MNTKNLTHDGMNVFPQVDYVCKNQSSRILWKSYRSKQSYLAHGAAFILQGYGIGFAGGNLCFNNAQSTGSLQGKNVIGGPQRPMTGSKWLLQWLCPRPNIAAL